MKMSRNIVGAALAAFLLAPALGAQQKAAPKPAPVPQIDIPYTKFVLKNGLTVLHHEDRKAPIVAVNLWYHVGSKNEPQGRSGFAHLFEHLMFNGSENFNQDYFKALERVGATDLNGTTNEDRTNYFQNVPKSALDMVLWLESDRMGHLLGSVDQAKLDEQRGVVQNEKRQYDNEPYSISEELITKAVWPANHPYSHTVIGSMDDLNAAKLDDVKEWFKTYYGPSNAVIVIAGDIDAESAKQKAEHYFGDIPPGPPVAHFDQWIAKRTGSQRQVAQDRVPQARVYRVWNIPGYGTADAAYMNLVSQILVGDKASRLYKRLVYDDQIATNVASYIDSREIASLFVIEATARPGDDLTKVNAAIDEELQKLLASGPTQDELDRIRTRYFSNFVRGAERIGGFGGKSDILAQSAVYGGSGDAYKKTLEYVAKSTSGDVHRAAKQWLSDGEYALDILPFPQFAAAAAGADRKKLPEPSESPAPSFPKLARATLANGMNVIVAERHTVPVVNFNLHLDAGFAADQFAQPGTAALAMNMVDEGTKTRDALTISKDLSRLGATLTSGSNLDSSLVNLSVLKPNLDEALNLYSDVILNPGFPQADFDRLKQQQLAAIQREKAQPIQMAIRVFPGLLYGAGHAYGNPLTGSGTQESVSKLTRADMEKFHQTWFKPNNATLVVVGDTTLAEIQPKLEKLFANWKRGDVPQKNIGTVAVAQKPAVYIIDKPGAAQSVILTGVIAPPKSNPQEIAIETMNTILGGAFISRLNMNLREDKHWSYGASSLLPASRGQRMFIAFAPVQTDKTKESMVEVAKELKDVTKDRLITADELAMAKSNLTLALPGSWETANAVGNAIGDMVRFNLPVDYYETYAGKVKSTTLNDMNQAAMEVVRPDNLIWVIVGDRSKIEKGIRELGYGEIRFMDADGKPVE
ncbi:MAG TPA: pitrilysin family protein [Thermoanaerobaculia bacterium]|jgi:zinc protease|nr:pitrilysin family protein [Thermoanaerobaculia bacterium]